MEVVEEGALENMSGHCHGFLSSLFSLAVTYRVVSEVQDHSTNTPPPHGPGKARQAGFTGDKRRQHVG